MRTVLNRVDPDWDYAPGKSNLDKLIGFRQQKMENLPWQLARSNVMDLVNSSIFARFFSGELHGEFPVAVLPVEDQALLGSDTATVLLSQHSLSTHLLSHPEIGLADYRKIQTILEEGEVYRQGDERLIYLALDGVIYRAALKRTMDGQKNYFLTLFIDERGKPPGGAVKVER